MKQEASKALIALPQVVGDLGKKDANASPLAFAFTLPRAVSSSGMRFCHPGGMARENSDIDLPVVSNDFSGSIGSRIECYAYKRDF